MLKLLVENGRTTDTEIAKQMNITTQAVGKIRKKLESIGLVKGYSTIVDYDMLGINTFAVVLFKLKSDALKMGEEDIKDRVSGPHLINFYRIPEGDVTHIVTYGFRSLAELDNYFHALQTDRGHISEIRRLYVFSSKSLMKDNPKELIQKAINELGQEKPARPEPPKKSS